MHIFFTIIAVISRIFANSLSNVFQKKLACCGENPIKINFINYLIPAIACIPVLFFIDYSLFTFEFWKYAILCGITGALCNSFMVLALKYGELSVLGPINSYKAIIGLIFGIFLLHEIPNIYGLLGMGLIIAGTYFIFDSPKEIFTKSVMYRFLALFFSAIESVLIKKVILLSSISVSFIISATFGAIFSYFIVKLFDKEKIEFPAKSQRIIYLLTAGCFVLMTFSTAFVFKYMNVGYALSLFQISVIINVVLGYKLFKEKNVIKKLFGSLIILIGSAIIFIYGR